MAVQLDVMEFSVNIYIKPQIQRMLGRMAHVSMASGIVLRAVIEVVKTLERHRDIY